jgi:hypothetical protein
MAQFFILVVAALEVTAVSLPLTALTSLRAPWPLLLLAVALGWLTETATGRAPAASQRPLLLLGAALSALLLPALLLGGPLAALSALRPGAAGFLRAYALLLLGLYLFWRGSRLIEHDGLSVATLFGRGVFAAVLSLILGALLGSGMPADTPPMLAQIIALAVLGLLALALGHVRTGTGRLGWPWLAILLAAISTVVLVATLATGMLGDGAVLNLVQQLLQLMLLPFALLGGLIVWLFVSLLAEPLSALLRALLSAFEGFELLAEPPPLAEPDPLASEGAFEGARRLAESATWLMALIPILILFAALLLLRRRAKRAAGDEERSSLGLLAGLRGDLGDLLGRLRNPFAQRRVGLRAALSALHGAEPSQRVRRAYIRLLLLLEAREHPRPPAQTPAELAPAAAALLAPAPIATLTSAYERARYDPAGATLTDAERAEAALRSLES